MKVVPTRQRLIDAVATLQYFRRVSANSTLTPQRRKEETMRSDLIFGALTHVNNRYELCQLASKATRKLHKPNTRLQDTTNEVLDRFKDTIPMDDSEAVVEKVQLQERRAA
jgi:predicted transcriptional regulator